MSVKGVKDKVKPMSAFHVTVQDSIGRVVGRLWTRKCKSSCVSYQFDFYAVDKVMWALNCSNWSPSSTWTRSLAEKRLFPCSAEKSSRKLWLEKNWWKRRGSPIGECALVTYHLLLAQPYKDFLKWTWLWTRPSIYCAYRSALCHLWWWESVMKMFKCFIDMIWPWFHTELVYSWTRWSCG